MRTNLLSKYCIGKLLSSAVIVLSAASSAKAEGWISDSECRSLRAYSKNNAETIYLFTKASSDLSNLRLVQAGEQVLNGGLIDKSLEPVSDQLAKAASNLDVASIMEVVTILNRICPE